MQEAADEASAQLRKNELLILASATGFKADVETLISDGAEVNCKDKEGTPLLHFPSAKGKLEVVKLLLSKGVDIDAEDRMGQTALHFAAQGNRSEVVKCLMKARAWVDAYDSNDDTALHIAIRSGHVDTVKHLLLGGAKMEIANNRNLTALGEAIIARQAEIVELLLDKGADARHVSKGYSLLHVAAGVGSESVLKVLLKYLSPTAVVHPGGVTPLHCATLKSVPVAVVRLLVDHGCDPHTADDNGKIPLDWAKEEGNDDEEVLKALSVGERKKRSSRRRSAASTTEIEPADGPEAEWNAFQRMSYTDKLRQVEVWARSKDDYLNTLVFLDEDSRKAVALVGNFMRMLECRLAVERMKNDESFQQDAADPQVQKAIAECTEHPPNIRKYAKNEKIMNVFVKLKRLQEVLRRNGRMKILYQELLNSGTSAEETLDDQAMTTEELEKSLKTAKEAVVKAVIGGPSAPKKQDDGSKWWSSDATSTGDVIHENRRPNLGVIFKSVVFQFLRQFLFAMLVFGVMVFGMYLTDSLPAQSSLDEASKVATPAFVTGDRGVHDRIHRGDYRPEL